MSPRTCLLPLLVPLLAATACSSTVEGSAQAGAAGPVAEAKSVTSPCAILRDMGLALPAGEWEQERNQPPSYHAGPGKWCMYTADDMTIDFQLEATLTPWVADHDSDGEPQSGAAGLADYFALHTEGPDDGGGGKPVNVQGADAGYLQDAFLPKAYLEAGRANVYVLIQYRDETLSEDQVVAGAEQMAARLLAAQQYG